MMRGEEGQHTSSLTSPMNSWLMMCDVPAMCGALLAHGAADATVIYSVFVHGSSDLGACFVHVVSGGGRCHVLNARVAPRTSRPSP
jgi:hypothetical protein